MANEMQTFVTVKSNEPRVAKRLQEIFKSRRETYEVDAIDVINNLEATSYCYKNEKENYDLSVDFPPTDLWNSIIGSKWMYVEYDHNDLPEDLDILNFLRINLCLIIQLKMDNSPNLLNIL